MTAAERVTQDGDGTSARRHVDSFLGAKLRPPDPRWNWVPRDRLVRELDRATVGCSMTLLAAPAGFGKTTAVAQWSAQLSGRALAWVALDAGDNDPVRLWTHIVTALQRAGCLGVVDVTNLVGSDGAAVITDVLPTVVDEMVAARLPVVLVLDDYHFVHAEQCHEQIDFLIAHLPPSCSLVILTRSDPALRLGRIRVAGRFAEIRADQLAFNPSEAEALLTVQDVHLPGTALAELMARTEGWPAGIYLAALSLSGRDDPETFVHQFSGDNRFIVDYLVEEVLNQHSPELRKFILGVSVFERFSAELCDFVLDSSSSTRLLRYLERSNLFLLPLDANRQWFRLHHLFAAVARSELEAEDSARSGLLHERASDWFEAHGFADEAIRHAIAAGATIRVSRLIEANWIGYVGAGRAATVDAWLAALRTPGGTEPDPAALVTTAWLAMVRGDEAAVNESLRVLDGIEDDHPLPDGTRSVESAVALIRGMSGYGGPSELHTSAERAVQLETDASSPWFSLARLALGHERYVVGYLDGAMQALPMAAYDNRSFPITRQMALALMSMTAR
ncbi:MAG: hypothetical protein L0H41_07945, partial [Microlunatus sp.]|nr:hypothetical protein [Microlunatus sp.]